MYSPLSSSNSPSYIKSVALPAAISCVRCPPFMITAEAPSSCIFTAASFASSLSLISNPEIQLASGIFGVTTSQIGRRSSITVFNALSASKIPPEPAFITGSTTKGILCLLRCFATVSIIALEYSIPVFA